MSTEKKADHNLKKSVHSCGDTTRRKFIKTGLKGITLLPYVAPLIETYFIDDAHADDDGGGSGSGSGSGGGGGRGRGRKITPPPGRGKGKGKGGGSGSGSGYDYDSYYVPGGDND